MKPETLKTSLKLFAGTFAFITTTHAYTYIETETINLASNTYNSALNTFARLNNYEKKPTISPIDIKSLIIIEAQTALIDSRLMIAVAHIESNFDPNRISKRNAIGLLQVIPANLKFCELKAEGDLLDPVKNVRCGCRIMANNLLATGNVKDALRVYNAGYDKNTKQVIRNNPEVEQYVKDVLAARAAART